MAEYITDKDLLAYIDANDLASIEHTIEGETPDNNVDKAIINRCSYANTLLANKYQVPFEDGDNHITEAFKAAICHLVLYDLLTGYDSVSDHELQIRRDNAKSADQFLKDVRDGKQDLITELNDEAEKTDRYFFNSNKRITSDFH